MALTPFVRHIPCPSCGSSDAGALHEDGSAKCYSCGSKWWTGDTDQEPQAYKGSMGTKLIGVEVGAITSRGIDETTAKKFGYGYGEYRGDTVHVATYKDQDGVSVAQHIRTRDKEFRWIGDHDAVGLWGRHLWRSGGKMVVLTEGEIDAMSVSQAQGNKYAVASVPNGAASAAKYVAKDLDWLEKFERVVLMFDMDEPGQAASVECARILSPGKAYIATLPGKDPNVLLTERRSKEIVDAAWEARPWRPDGIVAGEDIWDGITTAPSPTIAHWPWPGLDHFTRGIRRGEILLLVAGTGAGKSTSCRNVTNDLIDQGLKGGILSLEEPWTQFAYSLLGIRAGKNVRLCDDGEIDQGMRPMFDEIKDRLVFYDDQGMRGDDQVFDQLRYMALAEKCDFVVVDHLTVVLGSASEQDDRRHAERFMSELEALVKRTGIVALVVMHLKNVQGESHEDGRPVSISDIKGSGMIPQLCHQIVAHERDPDLHFGSRERLLKCRWTVGSPPGGIVSDLTEFNEQTGRLVVRDLALDTVSEEQEVAEVGRRY